MTPLGKSLVCLAVGACLAACAQNTTEEATEPIPGAEAGAETAAEDAPGEAEQEPGETTELPAPPESDAPPTTRGLRLPQDMLNMPAEEQFRATSVPSQPESEKAADGSLIVRPPRE